MKPIGGMQCSHRETLGAAMADAPDRVQCMLSGTAGPDASAGPALGFAHHVHRKPARRATGSPPAAAARGADAGMVALTRATGIVIGVMASLLLSCIIFPKSASMSARAAAQKARS